MSRSVQDFIYLVKSRPALYNANLREHDDKRVVEKLWQEIAKETNNTASECRSKWSTLRNSFARYVREEFNIINGYSGKRKRKQWYLANVMSFVRDHLHQRVSPKIDIQMRDDSNTRGGSNITDDDHDDNDDDANDNFSSSSLLDNKNTALDNTESTLDCKNIKIINAAGEKLADPLCGNLSTHFNSRESEEAFLGFTPTHSTGKKFNTIHPDEKHVYSSSDYLRLANNQIEMEDQHLKFFKSILPDIQKLTERRQRLFKQNVLLGLNKLLDAQEDESLLMR